MRIPHVIAAAALVAGAACSPTDNRTLGLRADGVMVECAARGDGLSKCAAVDDPCDATTVLWPPNHKLVRFTLADCALPPSCGGGGPDAGIDAPPPDDDGGIIERTLPGAAIAATGDVHLTSITVDEAVDVGKGGDGHTPSGDVVIIDPTTFDLRSERQGGGDGRVYRASFVDAAGATASCEFHVPHNQGPTSGALDSGTVVTVTP